MDLTGGAVVELSAHQNIAGIKDPRGNVSKVREMIATAASGFYVLAGAAGDILATASVALGL